MDHFKESTTNMVMPAATIACGWWRRDCVRRSATATCWGATAARSSSRCCPRAVVRRREWSANSRAEEHTSELQSLMRISYAVFCLKQKILLLADRQLTFLLSLFSSTY